MGHISRQAGVFFAGTIFTAAAGYFLKVYLARALGAEALGIYALGMTMVGFLGIFNAFGLPQSAVRFVAAYTATGKLDLLRGFLARSLIVLVVSNLLFGAIVVLLGPWISTRFYHTPALKSYLGWFALIMMFGSLSAFLGQVLGGYKDVARRTVITNFVGVPLMIGLTVVLVTRGMGLRGYVLAQAITAAVVLMLLVSVVWRITPRAARTFSSGLPLFEKEVISFSVVVFGIGFLEFSMAQADKVLIGFYLDARELGIYAVAAALVAFVPIMLQTVNQIFSPTIADLHARQQRELLGRIFRSLTKWILGLTLPLAAVMIIFAPALMRIFGHDFEGGWPILAIGTLGQLVNCGVGSVGYLLLMSGNQLSLIRIQAVTACLMVALSLVLIPRWGITGAAVASAVTNVVANVWYLSEVRRTLGLFPHSRSYWRLLLPLLGGLVTLFLLRGIFGTFRPEWMVIAAALLLAYGAFIGVALAIGLDADDRLVARAVWSRLRASFTNAEAGA
jgi:O-antigen/teichoic acid export membrane protein